jgi:hypothetical protein
MSQKKRRKRTFILNAIFLRKELFSKTIFAVGLSDFEVDSRWKRTVRFVELVMICKASAEPLFHLGSECKGPEGATGSGILDAQVIGAIFSTVNRTMCRFTLLFDLECLHGFSPFRTLSKLKIENRNVLEKEDSLAVEKGNEKEKF